MKKATETATETGTQAKNHILAVNRHSHPNTDSCPVYHRNRRHWQLLRLLFIAATGVVTAGTAVTAPQAQGSSHTLSAPPCDTGVTGSPTAAADSKTAEVCTIRAVTQTEQIQLEGRIEAVQQVTLAAQVAGTVRKLTVSAGQNVRQGQLLLRMDARAATANTRATQAQVQAGNAQLAVAQKHLARQRQLYAKNFISQAALEQAQAQVNALAAQVKAQRAQTQAAGSQTDYYSIRAPFDGVVAKVHTELGDMAMPGRPVLQLYRADRLRATVHAPADVAAQLRSMDAEQRQSSVQVHVNGKPLRVRQVSILPVADAASNTVEVRCGLDAASAQQAGVLPGEFARIGISGVSEHRKRTDGHGAAVRSQARGMPPPVRIPAVALIQRAQLYAVYVVRPDGSTVLRYVRPGRQQSGMVYIASGLEAGDVISLRPDTAAVQSQPAAALTDSAQ